MPEARATYKSSAWIKPDPYESKPQAGLWFFKNIARIHFLMDLKDAAPAGEIEDVGPQPREEGE